jgi:hypothetical protein
MTEDKVKKVKKAKSAKPSLDAESSQGIEGEVLPPNPVGRPTKYDPTWMLDKIVELGKAGAFHAEMAMEIGISIQTFHVWRGEKPEFSEAVEIADGFCKAFWEKKGRMAVFGEVAGFNSTGFMFTMRNKFSDYKDIRTTELTGKDGGAIQMEAVTLDPMAFPPEQRALIKQALLDMRKAAEDKDD